MKGEARTLGQLVEWDGHSARDVTSLEVKTTAHVYHHKLRARQARCELRHLQFLKPCNAHPVCAFS